MSSCLCSASAYFFFFFFKQKTAYEMRISDWSSDVCSSDLTDDRRDAEAACEDRGMRQRAAIFGNERGDVQLREQDDFGRRDVVRDHHERVVVGFLRQLSFGTHQHALDARADERDIIRSEEQTSELQTLMRSSYAAFCLTKTTYNK